ncbi:MAG: precorrin-3B C(17)-methyltransferase, partial [Mesorhizobium sp.]|nr:precorrin-3B C(17)-methyltransferase [Mesorhizobium sp.]
FGRAAGRPDERIDICLLANAEADMADMATCIIIGSPETRIIRRGEKPALVYTPRSAAGPRK